MMNRFIVSSIATVLALAVAGTALAQVAARAPDRGTVQQLQKLSAKPTPKLSDGRIDFNGTWDHLGGIEFVRPVKRADGSICLIACGPAPGGAPPAPFPPVQTDFPKYKPEFQAKVDDLKKRQVELDTNLRCQAPGVPRIGPPAKIIQNAREVVFLYDDVNGAFFRIIPTDGRPHQPSTMRYRLLQHDMRIDTHQFTVVVGVAIARAGRARLDVAHHRTGIAADLVATAGGRRIGHEQACSREGADRSRFLAARSLCSYTNDVARGRKRCQAAPAAKGPTCRIIPHLPRRSVHKASSALQRGIAGLHVCTQTVSFPGRSAQSFAAQRRLRGA